MTKRKNRVFTAEYKAEVVEMVRNSDKMIPQLAKDLGLESRSVADWVKKAAASNVSSVPMERLSTEERTEFVRLKREIIQIKMERDFLKKTAAFFAREVK